MKQSILELVSDISIAATCENPLDKQSIIACAVGLAASVKFGTLPSSEVEIPGEHYVSTVMAGVEHLVYELNENVIFNREKAMSIARAYWLYRYNILYSKPFQTTYGGNDFFCEITQVPRYFSDEDYSFMTAHRKSIRAVAGKIVSALEE